MQYYLSRSSMLRKRVWEIHSFNEDKALFEGSIPEACKKADELMREGHFDYMVARYPKYRLWIDAHSDDWQNSPVIIVSLSTSRRNEYLIGVHQAINPAYLQDCMAQMGKSFFNPKKTLGSKYPLV